MVNYQHGKVYMIESKNNILKYVGSTTRPLSERKGQHVRDYRSWLNGKRKGYTTSFDVIKGGDVDIVLLQAVPCESKEHLHKVEREWITKTDCVNKTIPLRSDAEYKADNKENIKQYNKKYYDDNVDRYKVWQRNSYEKHKEVYSQKVHCECGSIISQKYKESKRHQNSEKHQAYLAWIM